MCAIRLHSTLVMLPAQHVYGSNGSFDVDHTIEAVRQTVLDLRRATALLESRPEGLRLVDVRDPEEFEICRLDGAELMPLVALMLIPAINRNGATDNAIGCATMSVRPISITASTWTSG
jgi:hypothetical protein